MAGTVFATWASANDWNIMDLMEYVGWRDIRSVMRYVDRADPFAKYRIEARLRKNRQDVT